MRSGAAVLSCDAKNVAADCAWRRAQIAPLTTTESILLPSSRSQLQELVVYRFRGSTACLRGDESSLDTLPPNIASNFGTFFVHVHTVKITLGTEQLHREFCVFLRNGQYALLATSQFCERCAAGRALPSSPRACNCWPRRLFQAQGGSSSGGASRFA